MSEKEYIRSLFVHEDEILYSIYKGLEERELPQISVPPEIGKTLYLLVKMSGAKKICEIGALGGYSTIWLARAIPEDGQVLSLENRQAHADFAIENVEKAGLSSRVTFMVNDAMEILTDFVQKEEKFDFFFIDADKPNYINYLEKAIQLARPGTIITADNLLQSGRIFDLEDQGPSPTTVRQFNEKIATDPRLESILLPIGDGLGICRVK
ncbi:O-methyltransferase [Hazenella coriacea]|uniref:Putative O-methyltransferase YrrM n=1 Tax=Hazenella coriacea TaxID=1179467 RepID=A0A4V2UV80_9BACL|nr:O-methyltransferase [Hazenella coriacea]TCS94717.1 putative O-methyltransferase YrrM [Hazenella coriacea]